jgi:hypothetical protein
VLRRRELDDDEPPGLVVRGDGLRALVEVEGVERRLIPRGLLQLGQAPRVDVTFADLLLPVGQVHDEDGEAARLLTCGLSLSQSPDRAQREEGQNRQ